MNLESFIQSVKENECLWVPHLDSYKDTHLKETIWCELAKKHRFDSVRQAKAAWKRLRDVQRALLKKRQLMRDQGITFSRRSRWPYLDKLTFLVPFITRRNASLPKPNFKDLFQNEGLSNIEEETYNNEDETSNNEEETYNHEEDTDYNKMTFDSKSKNDTDTGESSKKRVKQEIEFKETMRDSEPDILSVKSLESNNSSVVTKFFESMAETTKEFPEYLQIEVKRKIFNIISDAEERNLKDHVLK